MATKKSDAGPATTTSSSSSNHEEVGEGERSKMLSAIVESLARSRENESWGLMVEAAEDYQRLEKV